MCTQSWAASCLMRLLVFCFGPTNPFSPRDSPKFNDPPPSDPQPLPELFNLATTTILCPTKQNFAIA